jgi:pantoate--beta-alanine ligase
LIVRRVVRDLFLPVEVVGHPIVREADGLAMSSRNAYLSAAERERALALVRGLHSAAVRFGEGERSARELERLAREPIERAASSIDYVEVRDPDTLAAVAPLAGPRALLAIACRIGSTRLIDNIVLGEEAPPLAP